MSILLWDGSLSTGLEEIDTQHKELFRIINSFHDKIMDARAQFALVEALDSLKSYAKYHFRTEEGYMRRYGYADYEAHKAEHEQFTAQLDSFLPMHEQDADAAHEALQCFMVNWLIKHIQFRDLRYVLFFKEVGAIQETREPQAPGDGIALHLDE